MTRAGKLGTCLVGLTESVCLSAVCLSIHLSVCLSVYPLLPLGRPCLFILTLFLGADS